MNGTALRIASAACVVALAATPSAALAKKHHRAHRSTAPTVTVVVPHDYLAGGNGAPLESPAPGVRINLFDPLQLAQNLGNHALGSLGLPAVQLPTL